MKTSVIVPARSGSKRLVGKNLKLLAGRPLIFHTLDACMDHAQISTVVFTTDSTEYANLVKREYGERVQCVLRPERTATDKAKVVDEVRRLLGEHADLFPSPWFAVCLPTAPLRTRAVMQRALDAWQTSAQALFSAVQYDFPVQFAFRITADGDWSPVLGEQSPMITGHTRSQDIEPLYRPNGAIYIQTKDAFLASGQFYTGAHPFLMSALESVDVDTAIDFSIADQILREAHTP